MKIGNFDLNRDGTYIIAELSANHNGNLQNALDTIKAAKDIGADCIKIQTYTADTMTLDCKKDDFIVAGGTLWDGRYLYALYQEAYTPWEWHKELFEYAREIGIDIFSSPFDKTAVDFLEQSIPQHIKLLLLRLRTMSSSGTRLQKENLSSFLLASQQSMRFKMLWIFVDLKGTTTSSYSNAHQLIQLP